MFDPDMLQLLHAIHNITWVDLWLLSVMEECLVGVTILFLETQKIPTICASILWALAHATNCWLHAFIILIGECTSWTSFHYIRVEGHFFWAVLAHLYINTCFKILGLCGLQYLESLEVARKDKQHTPPVAILDKYKQWKRSKRQRKHKAHHRKTGGYFECGDWCVGAYGFRNQWQKICHIEM